MNDDMVNAIPEGGDIDESFDILLPVSDAVDGGGATHVAHMRGNEAAFVDVVAEFVRTGSNLSAPLRSPIDESTMDHVRLTLDGLGPGRVESIEPL